jgi:hypothetical protein
MKKLMVSLLAVVFFSTLNAQKVSSSNRYVPQLIDTTVVLLQSNEAMTFATDGIFFYELDTLTGTFERVETGKERSKKGCKPVTVVVPYSDDTQVDYVILVFKDNNNQIHQAKYYYNRHYTTADKF